MGVPNVVQERGRRGNEVHRGLVEFVPKPRAYLAVHGRVSGSKCTGRVGERRGRFTQSVRRATGMCRAARLSMFQRTAGRQKIVSMPTSALKQFPLLLFISTELRA